MSAQEMYIGRDADIFSARACSLSMMLETSPTTGVGECRICVQRGGNAAVEYIANTSWFKPTPPPLSLFAHVASRFAVLVFLICLLLPPKLCSCGEHELRSEDVFGFSAPS